MKSWTTLALGSSLAVCALAQQTERPQLRLRIVLQKRTYALNERLMVKSELTNLTSRTLCFPVPDQDCESTSTGWLLTTGYPLNKGERDSFICHADGGGIGGAKLESDIKDHWIMLAPNAVYTTKVSEANVTLSVGGDWKLKASYHPPVGAFSGDYAKTLQSTAEQVGCKLPDSISAAEPETITVLSDNSKDR